MSEGRNLCPVWLVILSWLQCWRHLIAAIQLVISCSDLACCCDLKQTGTFVSESKVMCFFKMIFKN